MKWVPRNHWSLALALGMVGCHRPIYLDAQVATSRPLDAHLKVDFDLVPRKVDHPLQTVVLPGATGPVRVALIEVDGLLVHENPVGFGSNGANPVVLFHEKLLAAENDPQVQTVVLRINSPGGTVSASEAMAGQLRAFRQRTGKPVFAHILENGTGGAYRLAIEADRVIATPAAQIGGVGVIFPLVAMDKSMEVVLLDDLSIKAGKHIDLGSLSRKMEPSEKEMLESMAREHHQRFQDAVRNRRASPLPPDTVLDGRVMTSSQAMKVGLVDEMGTLEDTLQLAAQYPSLSKGTLVSGGAGFHVVMYRNPGEKVVSIYDLVPNQPIQGTLLPASFPGLDRGRQQTFWYLWMADPTLPRTLGK